MARSTNKQTATSSPDEQDDKKNLNNEGVGPDGYEALPLPPAKRLQPDTFFAYCKGVESRYPERLSLYLYRIAPFIDRSRTKNDRNIWSGGFIVEDGDARVPLTVQWIVEKLPAGSGHYKLLAADPLRVGRGHKDLCYCYFAFEDWDAFPPVIDFAELVLSEPKNERYIQWLKSRGTKLPEQDDMATNEVVKELTGLVREVADKKDNGASGLAIVEAIKTGASFAQQGLSLADALTLAKELRPPAPDNTPFAQMFTLMQQQMERSEERHAKQIEVLQRQLEVIANRPASAPPPRDEFADTIVQRFMSKALDQAENPQPQEGFGQYIPLLTHTVDKLGSAIVSAFAPRPAPRTAQPSTATAPASQTPAVVEPPQENEMKKPAEQISPYVLQIQESLLKHLEEYDGERFAVAFLNYHGRMKFGFLVNMGADELFAHLWTHPAVRAFGEKKVRQFIQEFITYNPDNSEA